MTTVRYPYNEASKPVGRSPDYQQSLVSIVPQAVAILREEMQTLAAGGVDKLPTALMAQPLTDQTPAQSLPEPARSLVDTVVKSLKQRPDLLAQLLKTAADGGTRDSGKKEGVLLLHAPGTVAAGDVAYISLGLENDDKEADECTLYATDLIGIAGHRIPASHVRVHPNPVRIPASGSNDVQIEIRVPSETPAGRYRGLLQTDDGESLRALIQVTVGL
jgi:hypothetical protein